jgi:hypothetical protein
LEKSPSVAGGMERVGGEADSDDDATRHLVIPVEGKNHLNCE